MKIIRVLNEPKKSSIAWNDIASFLKIPIFSTKLTRKLYEAGFQSDVKRFSEDFHDCRIKVFINQHTPETLEQPQRNFPYHHNKEKFKGKMKT